MTSLGGPRRIAVLAGLFLIAVGMAIYAVRPVDSASIGPDAAAPVIEFQRLLAGQQVEGHLTQTSKPFLDVVYGPIFELSGDWRPVAWSAILAFGLAVVLATVLAERVGGRASGAFAAAAFTLSPILLVDLSLAYAVTWMTLFLLIAGLAVTAARPRYELAGIALMLAALARPETLAVVAVAGGVLVLTATWSAARHRPGPARGAWLVLLGALAVPILMAHDQLLFGDALFWSKTAVQNSEGRAVRGLFEMIRWVGQHFLGDAALLPLAAVAGWLLVTRRQWGLAVGLVGVTLGIAALFVIIGARGTALSPRYLVPIDLGLLFASAIGVSALDAPAMRHWFARRVRPGVAHWALPVVGGLLVALAIAPIEPLDTTARASIATQVRLHANARRALSEIAAQLGPVRSWRGLPPSQNISSHPAVIVPTDVRAQAVAQLGLPLTDVAYSYPAFLNPTAGRPGPGTLIYHDRRNDHPASPRDKLLEISRPTTVGPYRYVPILADPAAGIWVIRVEDAASP